MSFIGEDAKTWFRSNQDDLANPRIVSWDDLKREMRKQFYSSERMVLCEEEVVTFIKNQIPLQLGKQVPSESLLRLLLELFSLKVVK